MVLVEIVGKLFSCETTILSRINRPVSFQSDFFQRLAHLACATFCNAFQVGLHRTLAIDVRLKKPSQLLISRLPRLAGIAKHQAFAPVHSHRGAILRERSPPGGNSIAARAAKMPADNESCVPVGKRESQFLPRQRLI